MDRIVVNQSEWGQIRVTGVDRLRFLQGMVSNDVAALAPGGFCRATILNVKGRVQAIVDVVADVVAGEESFLVLTEAVTADKVHRILDLHAIADDVAFAREARPMHRVWATPADVWTAAPIFDGAAAEGDAEVRRVEAGMPRYGVDVSEDNFPFEANLDAALSYTKGCYTGQEVVARASARGHANKRLVGLRLPAVVPPGTTLGAAARADAGVVTSSVASPVFGPIALAYLHKSVWTPGTTVRAGEHEGVVTALPFVD